MKTIQSYLRIHGRSLAIFAASLGVLLLLLFFRLGTLVGGMSRAEQHIALTPIGWHGIWQQPLYLPLELLRSIIFKVQAGRGSFSVRLPSVFLGFIAIISMATLLRLWHGVRSAVLGTLLFATTSWTLHASRLGSADSFYLCALPVLLLSHVLLQKNYDKKIVYYGTIIVWGVLFYVPGVVWFVVLNAVLQRKDLGQGWRRLTAWWQRVLYIVAGLIWLPLLIVDFIRSKANLRLWLGLPTTLARPLHLLKQLGAVFVHLFIRGPAYPQIWLGRTPLLDIFTLTVCALGIYFYALHYRAQRTKILGYFFILGAFLIALGGPVPLSLLVPLLFLFATAGIAYLLHEWLSVFPVNPLARNIGITIMILAVLISCFYNIRAYFIVWPHDTTTQAVFHLKD